MSNSKKNNFLSPTADRWLKKIKNVSRLKGGQSPSNKQTLQALIYAYAKFLNKSQPKVFTKTEKSALDKLTSPLKNWPEINQIPYLIPLKQKNQAQAKRLANFLAAVDEMSSSLALSTKQIKYQTRRQTHLKPSASEVFKIKVSWGPYQTVIYPPAFGNTLGKPHLKLNSDRADYQLLKKYFKYAQTAGLPDLTFPDLQSYSAFQKAYTTAKYHTLSLQGKKTGKGRLTTPIKSIYSVDLWDLSWGIRYVLSVGRPLRPSLKSFGYLKRTVKKFLTANLLTHYCLPSLANYLSYKNLYYYPQAFKDVTEPDRGITLLMIKTN